MNKMKSFRGVTGLCLVLLFVLSLSSCTQKNDEKKIIREEKTENTGRTEKIEVSPPFACLALKEKQQFRASEDDVSWGIQPTPGGIPGGVIDQKGLFTALETPTKLTVVAFKGGYRRGTADVLIVHNKSECFSITKEAPTTGGEWNATLNFRIASPIADQGGVHGDYVSEGVIEFCFASQGAELILAKAGGKASVRYFTTNAVCSANALKDTNLRVTSIAGKKMDDSFIFGKGSIVPDHHEGLQIRCRNIDWPAIPEASAISALLMYVAPITVKASDGATAKITGSWMHPLGYPGSITGSITVKRGCE